MSARSFLPSASIGALRGRAALIADLRAFFARHGVLEVDTPIASAHGTTDPALDSLQTRYQGPGAPEGQPLYLHTSPEFAMKRLLASGSGPIYQICKVFRDGECGRRHNPEFTMLEWYRPGFDLHALMDEVLALVMSALPGYTDATRLSYAEVFQQVLGIDPHRASMHELRDCALNRDGASFASLELESRDAWLDLLMTHFIEPALPSDRLTFIHDYPASQASLACIRPGDPPLAERFELYAGGMELANGFHELIDAAEQRARFEADNLERRRRGKLGVPPDIHLLEALEAGLPDCSGVALGIDRLTMLSLGASHIDEVLAFPLDRA